MKRASLSWALPRVAMSGETSAWSFGLLVLAMFRGIWRLVPDLVETLDYCKAGNSEMTRSLLSWALPWVAMSGEKSAESFG